jgi:hypothetical protein
MLAEQARSLLYIVRDTMHDHVAIDLLLFAFLQRARVDYQLEVRSFHNGHWTAQVLRHALFCHPLLDLRLAFGNLAAIGPAVAPLAIHEQSTETLFAPGRGGAKLNLPFIKVHVVIMLFAKDNTALVALATAIVLGKGRRREEWQDHQH